MVDVISLQNRLSSRVPFDIENQVEYHLTLSIK